MKKSVLFALAIISIFFLGVSDTIANGGIEVYVDIKPESCPNPFGLNPGRAGGANGTDYTNITRSVLPVAILGTEDFDVTLVDLSTVSLEGVAPLRLEIEDVATPYNGSFLDDCGDCTEEGPDGWTDLTLKFDKQEVFAAIGDVWCDECVEVTLSGNLLDGTPIQGYDLMWVNPKCQ